MNDGAKSPIQSKTLWTNLILAIVAFIPAAQVFIQGHPLFLAEGFAVINVGLRLITKDKISLQ
jgi:flagellar biosynthesis protein FliR